MLCPVPGRSGGAAGVLSGLVKLVAAWAGVRWEGCHAGWGAAQSRSALPSPGSRTSGSPDRPTLCPGRPAKLLGPAARAAPEHLLDAVLQQRARRKRAMPAPTRTRSASLVDDYSRHGITVHRDVQTPIGRTGGEPPSNPPLTSRHLAAVHRATHESNDHSNTSSRQESPLHTCGRAKPQEDSSAPLNRWRPCSLLMRGPVR